MAQNNFIDAKNLVDKLTAAFYEHDKAISQSVTKLADLNKQYAKLPSDYTKSLKEIEKSQQQITKTSERLNKVEKEAQRQRLAEIRLAQQREKAFDKYDAQLKREEAAKKKAIETLKKESREYKMLNDALGKVRTRAKDVAAEMFRLERQGKKNTDAYDRLAKRSANLTRQTQILDGGIKKIDASLGLHQRNVGNYAMGVENLHPILGRVNSQLMMMGTSLQEISGSGGLKTLGAQMAAFGRATLAFLVTPIGLAITALGGLYLLIRGNKDTVLAFDSGLKNVGKTTGMTDKELSGFGDKIVKLSRDLKTVGTPTLLEYATVAGQLGVKGSKNLLDFAEALAMLETASNISGEEGGANIARLLTLTDGGVQNVKDFADEIVNLGNNFAATEKEILDNATAVSQNTAMYGFGRQEVLAYGTATKALGIEQELAGSAIGRTLGIMERAIRTSEGIGQIAELTGQSVEALKRNFKDDAAGVFGDLLKGLNGVAESGGSVNEQLENLGVVAVRDIRVLGSLATSGYPILSSALDEVAKSAGAAEAEFNAANQKMTNQIKTFGVAWDNLVLTIEDGEGVFSKFFGWLSSVGAGFLDNITQAIESFGDALNGAYTPLERLKLAGDSFIRTAHSMLPIARLIPNWFKDSASAIRESTEASEANIEALRAQYSSVNKLMGAVTALTEEMTRATDETRDWTDYLYTDGNSENVRRTLTVISDEIKALNDEIHELNVTDIEGIRLRQKKIKQLEDERDRILGVTKKIKEYRKETEKVLSVLKEWEEMMKERERIGKVIDDRLKDGAKKELEGITANTDALEKENKSLLNNAAQREKDKNDRIFAEKQIEDAFVRLGETLGIQEQTTRDLFDGIKNGFADAGEAAEAFGALATDAINAIMSAQRRKTEQQIEQLEQEKNAQLEFAGDSSRAREEIEERFARKKAQLQRRQAIRERNASIIQANINIATSVIKTFAELGWPAGIVAGAIISALGLAQLAVIASQPIPQFEQGVRNFEGGTAIINEKRQEVVATPDGGIHRPKGKNVLVNLPKGSDVYKSEADFQRSLDNELSRNGIIYQAPSKEKGLTAMDVETAMRRAIGASGDNVLTIDKNGFTSYIQNGLTKTVIMNNRVKFRGKKV